MKSPDEAPSDLLELESGDNFGYLFFQGENEILREVSEGLSPTAGDDIWAIGVTVKNHTERIIGQEETDLTYKPRDSKRLKRDYRRSYRELVTPLQDMHSSLDVEALEGRILINTVDNMSEEGVSLLGGFCVTRGKEPGQIFPTVFYSKILSACYARIMREVGLSIEPVRDFPEEESNDEYMELLRRAINLENVDEFSIASGGIVASLLPQPATVSPQFGKGPKPLR